MPESDIDILAIDRGTVTAPAGCGKIEVDPGFRTTGLIGARAVSSC